jgi:nucleoside-diphosphate-sugar epimerase
MKVILTGATGFVGSNVLARLIADPRISEITCISRRPLAVNTAKVTTIVQEDFMSFDPELLSRLAQHRACIWALGGKASDLGKPELFTRITHGFTLAFAAGIASRTIRPFTFCYVSGMGADPSETSRLPWEKLTRHLKGRTEEDLRALQKRYEMFGVHAFRPGGILPDETSRLLRVALAPIVVSVGELATSLVEAALDDRLFRQCPIVHNGDIKRLAGQRRPAPTA